jgi:hypothetical protein
MMSLQQLLAPSARRSRGRAGLWCLGLLCSLLLSCATTSFVTTWKAPDAQPVDARGSKVVAVVIAKGDVMRRTGEDRLASEISARGAQGIAMYRLVPEAKTMDEALARGTLERENVKLIVVMRPVQIQKDVVVTSYGGPTYRGYWGGYHGYGWGHPYGGNDVRVDTVVSIETLVYSLPQNKLLWGGQSKTTNPENIGELVAEVAAAAVDELERAGLLVKR